MRIPNSELHNRHIVSYGSGGLDTEPGLAEPGCPLLYKTRYVDRSVPESFSPLLAYGSTIHEALALIEEEALSVDDALTRAWDPRLDLERWEEAHRDLRRTVEREGYLSQLHTVAVEADLSCDLYEDEDFGPIKYGGILDVIVVNAQSMDDPIPWIGFIDYKTDRGIPTKESVNEWKQGDGYAFLLRENAGRYLPGIERVRVGGVYEAVKRYPIAMEYSDERLDEFQAWASAVARAILRDKTAKPRLNPGCGFCPIKADCPEFQRLPGIGEALLARMAKTPIEKRGALLIECKDIAGKLKKSIDETTVALKERIRVSGPVAVGGNVEYVIEQGESRQVDVRALAELMGDAFYDVAKVTLGEVDRWIEDHPEISVESVIWRVPGAEQLKLRKVEDGVRSDSDQ